jgi:hypothetical protein
MKYGYDFNNPKERKMYFQKRQRDLKRQINTVDINDGLWEIIKEHQNEIQYFREREREDFQLTPEQENQITEEIETAVNDLLNSLKPS